MEKQNGFTLIELAVAGGATVVVAVVASLLK
jgi:Tfp pilus assembly protein PilE